MELRQPGARAAVRQLVEEAGLELFVSLSHEVSPTLGEFERFTATVINAIVGPRTAADLTDVEAELERRSYAGPFQIMQCNGGTTIPSVVRDQPVMMIGSVLLGLDGPQRPLHPREPQRQPGIEDGDIFLANDPWIGTGHQPDVNFLTPVFHESSSSAGS